MAAHVITADQLHLLRGQYVYLNFASEQDREAIRPLAKNDRI